MTLTLRTLGSLNLLDSQGRELTAVLSQPKRYALLVYLALEQPGKLHRRDALLPLFWTESREGRARASLSQALTYLRQYVPEGTIVTRGMDEVGVDASHLQIDALGFQQAVRSGAWQRAVELYAGDFLPGFHVRGAPNFDEWMSAERDRLRTAATNAAWTLAQDQVRRGELVKGEETASWALELVCPDDTTARRFVEALASAGERVAALRFFHRYEAALQATLELPPSLVLRKLAEGLRSPEAVPLHEALSQGVASGGEPPVQAASRQEGPPEAGALFPLPFSAAREERPAPMGEGLCFAGREEEMARLHQFLDRALKGRGTVAFITGEAGTGKSVLSREFCTRSLEAYPELLAATGYSDAHTGLGDAYRPFREILRLLTGDVEEAWRAGSLSTDHARRLWSILPTATEALLEVGPQLLDTLVASSALAGRAAQAGPDGVALASRVQALVEARRPGAGVPGQSQLFDQVGRVFRRIARERPLLLILEDLQWADRGSLDLLFQLGRHLEGSRVLLLGLYRPSEVFLGRNGERHPLLKAVNEFRMAAGKREVALMEDGDRPFLEAVIDSEPNVLGPSFRDALFHLTRGHALFTVELLREMAEERRIRRDERDRWAESPEIRWDALPDRIEAVLEERTSRLPDTLHRILSIASVEGERFTLEVVADLMEEEPARLLSLVREELEKRHRLVELEEVGGVGGRRITLYRFRHILFQQFLYRGLNEAERVLLHEQVGRSLERVLGEAAERKALELARHFREAGLVEEAVEYLVLASDGARSRSAYLESRHILFEALRLTRTLAESVARDRQELDVLSRLSRMSWAIGLFDVETQAQLVRFRELAERLQDQESRFWITACDSSRHHYLDEHEKGRRDLDEMEALARSSGNPSKLVVVHMQRALNNLNLGRPGDTVVHLTRMEELHDPVRDRTLLLQWFPEVPPFSRALKALAVGPMGYPETADVLSREAHALLTPETDWAAKLVVWAWDLCLRLLLRDMEAARRIEGPFEATARELGRSGYLALIELSRGWGIAGREDPERGSQIMRTAWQAYDGFGYAVWRPFFLTFLAEALTRARQADEALRMLGEALAWMEAKGGRQPEPEVHRVRGEALLALPQPDPVAAEAAFRKAIAVTQTQETKLFELRATTSMADLLAGQGRQEEAYRTLSACYDWFTEGFDYPDLKDAKTLLDQLG